MDVDAGLLTELFTLIRDSHMKVGVVLLGEAMAYFLVYCVLGMCSVCPSDSKRNGYVTWMLAFCMNWFKVRESFTSISLISSPGLGPTRKTLV